MSHKKVEDTSQADSLLTVISTSFADKEGITHGFRVFMGDHFYYYNGSPRSMANASLHEKLQELINNSNTWLWEALEDIAQSGVGITVDSEYVESTELMEYLDEVCTKNLKNNQS